jgi:hypothetical protein
MFISQTKLFHFFLFFSRHVFKKFEHGGNKQSEQRKPRKYFLLKKKTNFSPENKMKKLLFERPTRFSQNLMSTSQHFVRTSSRRFPTRSDSTEDFVLAAAESGSSPSRGSSPSIAYRRQVALQLK